MAEIVKPGVLFKKGLIDNLKPLMASGGKEGTFYLAEDERSLYFGTKDGTIERIQGSVLYFNSLQEFTNNTQPPYSTDIIYFIANDNALVRWNGTKWIQLNATAEAVNTAITELTTAINGLNETVGEHTTNIAQNAADIAQNTADIAQNAADIALKAAQADLEALAGRVTTNEGNIALKASQVDLNSANEAIGKNADDIAALTGVVDTKAAQADLTALDGRVTAAEGTIVQHTNAIATKAEQADLEALGIVVAANGESIETNAENIGKNTEALNTYKQSNDQRVAGVEGRLNTAESNINDLNTNKANVAALNELATTVGSVQESVAENTGKINTNTGDITDLKAKMLLAAKQSDLDLANQAINKNKEDIAQNAADIALKANASDLNATNEVVGGHTTAISGLQSAVATKAEQSAVNSLEAVVATKATQEDLDDLTEDVSKIDKTVEGHTTQLGQIEDSIEALVKDKVDVVEGSSLVKDTEIKKLEGVEEGANRIYVDKVLSDVDNEDTVNHVPHTSLVTSEINRIDGDIAAFNSSLSEQIEELGDKKADKTAVDQLKEDLEGSIDEIAEALGLGDVTGGTSLSTRVGALETTTADHETRIENAEERLRGIDETLEGLDDIYATQEALGQAKVALEAKINEEIEAANAMTYQGVVSADTALPTSDVKIGDTYVASAGFTLNDKSINPGDLLVANGTEGEDGYITEGTLSWDHVVTGYSTAFDQTLNVESSETGDNLAAINLNSHTNAVVSTVVIASANEGLTIDVDDNKITLNMVWGSFDD